MGGPDAWGWTAKLVPTDGVTSGLGTWVAVDGDTIAAGAPHSDDEFGVESGVVFVFDKVGGEWLQSARLAPSDGADDDVFGLSVSIHESTLVAGAPFAHNGVAYIFERDGAAVWTEVARLEPLELVTPSSFGASVAVYDDSVVIGSPTYDVEPYDNVGAAYVFRRQPSGRWVGAALLVASDLPESGDLGYSVAVGPDSLVGGSRFDDQAALDAGSAYVFRKSDLELAISGRCPVSISLELSGATPLGAVALVRSGTEGTARVPAGPCPGLAVDLKAPAPLALMGADAEGRIDLEDPVPIAACDLVLQAADVSTCTTSAPTAIP